MSGTSWLILLSVLALSGALSVTAMKRMSAPLPEYKSEEIEVPMPVSPRAEVGKAGGAASSSGSGVAHHSSSDFDVLWKKSLFQDDRTEDETAAGTESVSGAPTTNSEFELVGLARLGSAEKGTPIAIIVQSRSTQRSGRTLISSRSRRGLPPQRTPVQVQKPEEASPEERKANRTVFRTGDAVGKTGYVVKSIVMEENKVVLVKGSQVITLVLDEKNNTNSARREKVQKEEMAVRAKYKEPEKKETPASAQAAQRKSETDASKTRRTQPAVGNGPGGMPPAPPSIPGTTTHTGGTAGGTTRGTTLRRANRFSGRSGASPVPTPPRD